MAGAGEGECVLEVVLAFAAGELGLGGSVFEAFEGFDDGELDVFGNAAGDFLGLVEVALALTFWVEGDGDERPVFR